MFLPKVTQHQRQRSAPHPPHPLNPEAHQLLTSFKFATKLGSSQSKCEKTSRYYNLGPFKEYQCQSPRCGSSGLSSSLKVKELQALSQDHHNSQYHLFQVWKYVIELLLCQSPVELSLRDKNLRIRQIWVQIPALPLSVCETLDK